MTRQHATHGERDVVMTNLSVCLSVPLWCFIETNARKIKLFPPPGRGTAMVFSALPLLQNSEGNSLSGGVKYTGLGKFCDFRPEIAVYLGNGMRDKPRVQEVTGI